MQRPSRFGLVLGSPRLRTTLSAEMEMAVLRCGRGMDGVIEATERAISASFGSASTASSLRRRLEHFRRQLSR